MIAAEISVVVIGRNEGWRLAECLGSVRRSRISASEIIYVDSASTDDSLALAASAGARVIALSGGKLSAARARNAGWRSTSAPYVLFLDGDTILHPDFVAHALKALADPDVAVVWGNRRELRTGASVYNRLVDLDWIARPGYSEFCGGDSLMRRECLEFSEGFDADLIAGEEPDFCRRIRAAGGKILHIDVPMTGHDMAMHHFSQYWQRAVRTGYAYAEISARYRDTADPLWTAEARANFLRGSLYAAATPAVAVVTFMLNSWLPILVLAVAASVVVMRTAFLARWKKATPGTLVLFAIHSHVQHIPILQGQVLYFRSRWLGRGRELIEYKKRSS
jgi:glycosyltransferase involved in cell wall biosynthesis